MINIIEEYFIYFAFQDVNVKNSANYLKRQRFSLNVKIYPFLSDLFAFLNLFFNFVVLFFFKY